MHIQGKFNVPMEVLASMKRKVCRIKQNTVMPLYPLIQYPWFQLSAFHCGKKKKIKLKK
jgi:hypothetical protein